MLVPTATGRVVLAVKLPVRDRPAIRTTHLRTEGERLDHLAARYLTDASAFWRLCDASGTIAPDALASRAVVAVPEPERPR